MSVRWDARNQQWGSLVSSVHTHAYLAVAASTGPARSWPLPAAIDMPLPAADNVTLALSVSTAQQLRVESCSGCACSTTKSRVRAALV
jgi:hypothetical protein